MALPRWELYFYCSLIVTVTVLTGLIESEEILDGVVYRNKATLITGNYLVTKDIIVEHDGELRIQPGCQLRFETGAGITVRGILKAEGNANGRIRMTSLVAQSEQDVKTPTTIRLVDGPTIFAGRLQISHEGRWFSVCTNSRNWTDFDIQVACRELGFRGGQFYKWFDHNPDYNQLLYEHPNCYPSEPSLNLCNNNHTKKFGSGVCDDHLDIGIECDPQPTSNLNHWRGILFENAKFIDSAEYSDGETNSRLKVSYSSISYVHIHHAGFNKTGNLTSAIEVVGVPPQIQHTHVKYSQSNAINITSPENAIDIRHSVFEHNRGYGVFINSSTGRARIHNCTILQNGADGVRYVHHDPMTEPLVYNDFCNSLVNDQKYPLRFSMRQQKNNPRNISCEKVLTTKQDRSLFLTIHFLYWYSDKNGAGELEIRDGPNGWSPLLYKFEITNGSRLQSITTTGPAMWLRFNAKANSSVYLTIDIESDFHKPFDLNVTDTRIIQNNGRGIAMENIRSSLGVHSCEILYNSHVAGVHVLNGSGDVNITSSQISNNVGDGVNISYAGGRQNISYTTIKNNRGRGVALWFNQSSLFKFDAQNTILYKSLIIENLDYGMLVGNYCGNSVVNVTQSTFRGGGYGGLKILSCWWQNTGRRKVFVTLNIFEKNRLSGLEISPAVNMDAIIFHNKFRQHTVSALHIRNEAREELEQLSTSIAIWHNYFEYNNGYFVAGLGLCQFASEQTLSFMYNYLSDNSVREPFPHFNPRNRVAAVVTVASSNVIVQRNSFKNAFSTYDIGSHLNSRYSIINGTFNYFGKDDGKYVYSRIFDAKYRYNLASVEFYPFLLLDTDLNSTYYVSTQPPLPDDFAQTEFEIGGDVNNSVVLRRGEYSVTRDIVINTNGELKLTRGSILKFPRSVGMLIHGMLTVDNTDIYEISNRGVLLKSLEDIPMVNNSVLRLVGGKNNMEGRLQVKINNEWGTICNYRWTELDAALACHQLGYVLNPDDWLLEPSEMEVTGYSGPIHLSNVQCGHLDFDVRKCRAEKKGEFQNSCSHDSDVGIKCYNQGWAGVRVSMTARKRDLRDLQIEGAGLFDGIDNVLKPALQVDIAHFNIHRVNITKNIHAGLGVVFGNPFFDNKITESVISGNKDHGVVVHSQGLWLENCAVFDNRASGIQYNPVLTREEERNLVEWIYPMENGDSKYQLLNGGTSRLKVEREDDPKFYVMNGNPNVEGSFNIFSEQGGNSFQIIAIGSIDPNSTSQLTIQDGPVKIDLKTQLLRFPYSSIYSSITLNYNTGSKPLGKIALHITAFERRPYRLTPTIRIHNCDVSRNNDGISVYHYNRARGEWKERYLRVKNESIELYRSNIHDNKKKALLVITPHHESLALELANITYLINETHLDSNKGGGIMQISRDVLNSNNVFNWIIGGNTMTANLDDGIEVTFPYVWQSKLNETHSFYLQNNTVNYNRNFKLVVNGFFTKTFIRENVFSDNFCKKGLISILGMEKLMVVERNIIGNNTCKYMVEFNIESHTELGVNIPAYFKNNIVKSNRFITTIKTEDSYQPNSYTIGLRGVQKVNVTNNVFDRNMLEYQLLAGIQTSTLDNYVNARENYWGTTIELQIRASIFDFDDWNSFALADFSHYLLEPTLETSNLNYDPLTPPIFNNYLGGRIYNNTRLFWQPIPYIVRSDVTIMPGARLTIDPGVNLHFYPSVGILVLGALQASGSRNHRITMSPYLPITDIRPKREIRSGLKTERMLPSGKLVRLCTRAPCEFGRQGFLELYNVTTMQWTPVCDKRFTERNAEVICQELGYQNLNVFVKFGPRLDVDPTYLSRIRTWPEPRQCRGNEEKYTDCDVRLNGDFRHVYFCPHTADFVFVFCGDRNLRRGMRYWGGIRFANPNFEHKVDYRFDKMPNTVSIQDSVLEYVDIVGAGILHNEKSGAILATFNAPHKLEYINVTHCASDGVNLIAPLVGVNLVESWIEDNLGVGVNILELNGFEGKSSDSTFTPLKVAHIPYNLFGVLDVCASNKIVEVEKRILVYYRYRNHPMDCVKIFRSAGQMNQIGFRFLQLNLFDSTDDLSSIDKIRVIDGNIYDRFSKLLGEVTFKSDKLFFKTESKGLSIHMHANGATEVYGFVAEVFVLPAFGIGSTSERSHNLTYSVIMGNRMGGVIYSSTGELNPSAVFLQNQFLNNGIGMFGNFTSCEAAVVFDLRNTKSVVVQNNLIKGNQGGLSLVTEGTSAGSRLRALISHNLITKNKNRNALNVVGSDEIVSLVVILSNFITQNYAAYRDTIVIKTIHSNFTRNFVRKNHGTHTLAVHGYENLRLQRYQTTEYNSFYDNKGQTPEYSATIYAGGTGQNYENNILINLDNDYEIVARNRSNRNDENFVIDATNNWWGNDFYQSAISGRIRDKHDFNNLLEVQYEPYYITNDTLVHGKCPPGWTGVDTTCFIYVGGVMTRNEAKQHCLSEEGSMPYISSVTESQLRRLIREKQSNIDYNQPIWMLSLEQPGECVTFSLSGSQVMSCEKRLPFICETDPEVRLVPFMDAVTIATLGAAGGALLILLLCVLFWICKSRRRQQERFERRNSIRASKRSIRSISSGSLPSETSSCKRIISEQHKPVKMVEIGYKGGSFDSIEKAASKFDSSSYFNSSIEDNQSYEICEAANHKVEFSDFEDKFENESRPEMTSPSILHSPYKYSYNNKAFIDNTYPDEVEQQLPWGSSSHSTTESTADLKRYLETSLDTNGRDETYTPRSSPSTYSQEMPTRKQLLETDI